MPSKHQIFTKATTFYFSMTFDALLIADSNGIPIYSKHFGDQKVDEILLLGFFSALKTFAKSAVHANIGESNELRSIRIGNRLLDFDEAEFEQIGAVDVLLMSHGVDPTTTHAILEETTEEFAIFVDEIYTENTANRERAKRGRYPDFSAFDAILDGILSANETPNVIDYTLSVDIPAAALSLISDIFSSNPQVAEMYEYNEQFVLEQILSELAMKQMNGELHKLFKNVVKSQPNPEKK